MNLTTTSPIMSGFQKAQKVVKNARIGLCGVAGSGKTLTALKIALGLGKRIALIDTENNSSVLYGDRVDFDVLNLEPPFEIEKYINAIHLAENSGYHVLILDTISHAWAGEGGILDTQGKMADGGMNSFTAWRKLTPQHNAFVEAMVRSRLHLVATMRSKMEYVVETNDKGKSIPRKVGLAPVQREGMDYEFDIVFDIDLNHNAMSTKDRSSLFDGKMIPRPDEKIGKQILEWLNRGVISDGDFDPPKKPSAMRSSKPLFALTSQSVQAKPLNGDASPSANPLVNPEAAERIQLFNDAGIVTGEKETVALLEAIGNATTLDRLLSIDKSRRLGFNTNQLTKDQARQVRQAIDKRQSEIAASKATKAA